MTLLLSYRLKPAVTCTIDMNQFTKRSINKSILL